MFPNKALGDLPLEIIDGDRGANYPKTNEFSERGHCLFLNAGNVSASGFSFSDTAFISEEKDLLLRKGKAQRDDVILTTRGTVGNLALYDESVPFEHVRINSGMVLMRPDKTSLDPEFLYYALRSPAFSRQVASLQTGSAQPQLPIRDIKHLRIPFPDLSQQKEVSKRVKMIFDKIELNRRMNETLEEMARALFRDWFVDFGPTRRQMEGATDPAAIMGHAFPPEKAAALASLFPDKLGDDGLPEGWTTRAVSDFGKLKGGKQLPKKEFVTDGPFPVFGGAGHMGQTDKFNAEGYVITVGRVGAYCGNFVSHRGKAWVNNNASVIQLAQWTEPEWFFLALRELDLEPIKKGAAQPFVSNGDINELALVEPGAAVRQVANGVLSTFLIKIESNDQENQTLAEMRDLLLPKLMSGEIRLQDAEIST